MFYELLHSTMNLDCRAFHNVILSDQGVYFTSEIWQHSCFFPLANVPVIYTAINWAHTTMLDKIYIYKIYL